MQPCTRILYFAWLRERIGIAEETVILPDGTETVAAVVDWLRTRSAGHAAAFSTTALVRAAVNQVFARPDTHVTHGDEVAFFPPVTGG